MKKLLSFALVTALSASVFGQILVNENFETANLGALGTDVTGNTQGQNGWYTYYGSNADYQIATIDAAHGKSLTINSYNSYSSAANTTLNTRLAVQESFAVALASNNILRGKFDLYTGPSTGTGSVQMRVLGINGTATTAIGGFTYNVATKELRGLGLFTNLATFTPTVYSVGLAAAPGVLLTANTWVTLEFRYNKTTGGFTWYWPTGAGSISADTATIGVIPGLVAQDVYLFNVTDVGNNVSKTAGFDNIVVEFSNAAALSTAELADLQPIVGVQVYPNPTSDVLNIKSPSKIVDVQVFDLSGRKINVIRNGNEVDIRELQSGNYIINVETAEGKSSQKFIKK